MRQYTLTSDDMYTIDRYHLITRQVITCHTYNAAQYLLGRYIARYYNGVWCVGRIVETECYTDDDPACHAYRGKTKRNASLFGPVGHAYVYMIYGIHMCLNIVAYDPNTQYAGGVLIRAIEPVAGLDIMYAHRRLSPERTSVQVTNGPGKLAQACAIDRSLDGIDVCNYGSLMVMYEPNMRLPSIQATKRIGISQAQEIMWRFIITGNSHVSR